MFEKLDENLYAFYSTNYGSNVYLITGKKVTLIDSSLNTSASYLKESLSALGLTEKNIDLVLHTHGHADHIGCSGLFSNASKAMHSHDAKYVNLKDKMFTCSNILNSSVFPEIDSFLSDSETIDIYPYSLKVISTPGHTRGSVSFYEKKQGWLFSGDTLFKDGFGRFDLPTGKKAELMASLKKLKKLKFGLLLPGHGLTSREPMKENIANMLKNI